MSMIPMFNEFMNGQYASCNNFYASSIIYKVEYKTMVFVENILFTEWNDRIKDYYIEHNEYGASLLLSNYYDAYYTNAADVCSRGDACNCDNCADKHFKITKLKTFEKGMTDIYAMKKLIKYQHRHNSISKNVIVANINFSDSNLNRIYKRYRQVMHRYEDGEGLYIVGEPNIVDELYINSDSESMSEGEDDEE